jgi:hypothetical protein
MSDKITRKLTPQAIIETYESSETISSHLPHTFSTGVSFNTVGAMCPTCSEKAADDTFRGAVNTAFKDIFMVQGYAICTPCNCLFEMNLRIKPTEDGKGLILQQYDTEAGWVQAVAKPRFWHQLRRHLFK